MPFTARQQRIPVGLVEAELFAGAATGRPVATHRRGRGAQLSAAAGISRLMKN
jgi:hypothetical protein